MDPSLATENDRTPAGRRDAEAALVGHVRPAQGSFGSVPRVLALAASPRPPVGGEGGRVARWRATAFVEAIVEGDSYRFEPDPVLDSAAMIVALEGISIGEAREWLPGESGPEFELDPAPAGLVPLTVEVSGPLDESPVVWFHAELPLRGGNVLPLTLSYPLGVERTVELPPLPGTLHVRAVGARSLSETWSGDLAAAGGRITLELRDTFSVEGSLLQAPADLGPTTLSVRYSDETWEEGLAETLLGDTGEFVLPRVPWLGKGPYILRLETESFPAQEFSFFVEGPGETVQHVFIFDGGVAGAFRALDENGAPVSDAEVQVYWWGDDAWVIGGRRRTGEDGVVRFEGLGRTHVGLRVTKSGFVSRPYGPWELLEERPEPIDITLQPGAGLSGKVLLDGRPATDFSVQTWSGAARNKVVLEFHAREDGTFSMQDLSPGRLDVWALDEDHPPGEPVSVELVAGETAEVTLELQPGKLVSGQVLDITDGSPIEGARVQAWSTGSGGARVAQWGPTLRTDAHGRFTDFLIPSQNPALTATADGYGHYTVSDPRVDERSGSIPPLGLAPLQDLHVHLLAEPETDLSRYLVRVVMRQPGEAVPCDPSGEMILEDIEAGPGVVQVFPPRAGVFTRDIALVPGQPWEVTVPITTGKSLHVHVDHDPKVKLPESLWINAAFRGEGRFPHLEVVQLDSSGSAHIECADGERALVEVVAEDGSRWGTRSVELDPSGETTLEFYLQGRTYTFRLEDEEGTPLANSFVSIETVGDSTGYRLNLYADGEGRFTLRDPGEESLSVVVYSPQVKSLPHIVSLAEHDPEQEYVLRFDGGGRLRVQLHEGGDPAAAMNVRLEVPGNDSTAQVETSDASGTVVFTGLEEGDYLLHLEAPGWWSETQLVSVGPDETTLALNVRRRGSFRLHVIQAGLPVADASVSLHSRREGEDPVQWESDGLIKVEPVGWRTDLQGELRVSGLPEGTYDLEAVLPGGQTKTFPVMIEGGENLELTADFSQ